MVSVLVAENTATTQQVFVESMLVYIFDAEFWEFSFNISVVSLDGGSEEFATQDSRIARAFIPAEIRKLMVDIVCDSLRLLLTIENPDLIYRVTKGRNLSKRAMRKHHMITAVLIDAGYRTDETGTDQIGRTFWLMMRD